MGVMKRRKQGAETSDSTEPTSTNTASSLDLEGAKGKTSKEKVIVIDAKSVFKAVGILVFIAFNLFYLYTIFWPDLSVGDGVLALVELSTCPPTHPVLCDKTIVSNVKVREHSIPVLECRDHFDFINNDILCLQYNAKTNAVVVVEDNFENIRRRMRSSLEDRKAINIFRRAGLVGGDDTYRIARKSTVAGLGFYLNNEVGIEWRQNDYNKGNKLWEYAVLKLFNQYTTNMQHVYYMTSDNAYETSAVILSLSSILALESAEQDLYDALDQAVKDNTAVVSDRNLPSLILGIGLLLDYQEADEEEVKHISLTESQTHFFKEVERLRPDPENSAIAVQGEITAQACFNAGVYSCEPLGCPSLTLNREPNLGKILEDKWSTLLDRMIDNEKQKVVLVLPELKGSVGPESDAYHGIISLFYDLYKEHECYFVVQNLFNDKLYFLGSEIVDDSQIDENRFMTFIDSVENWIDFVKDVDVVVSARIFGAMAGIAASVPTVVIPVDYRILEMADAMKIPKVDEKKVYGHHYASLAPLLADAELNFKDFEINRRKTIETYQKMINDVGLEMDPTLVSILDEPIYF